MLKTRDDFIKCQANMYELVKGEKMRILVCAGTGCVANGSLKVYDALRESLKNVVYR